MGLINNKKNNDPDELRYDKLYELLDNEKAPKLKALFQELKYYHENPELCPIKPFGLYLEVLERISNNTTNFRKVVWGDVMKYAVSMYAHMFVLEERTPDFTNLSILYASMFEPNNMVALYGFIPTLFHLFTDKLNYVRWGMSFLKNKFSQDELDAITDFGTKIRPYCAEEDLFTAELIQYSRRIAGGEDPKQIAEQEYENMRRMSGVYDVSEERILVAEQKLDMVQASLDRLQDSLKLSTERADMLVGLSDKIIKDVDKHCKAEVSNAKEMVENLTREMGKSHSDFMEAQRKEVLADKDMLVNSVITDSNEALRSLKKEIDSVVQSARRDILRINRESGDVITRVEEYLSGNERIKDILADETFSKELNDKIDHLMDIYEENMKAKETVTVLESVPSATVSKKGGKNMQTVPVTAVSGSVATVEYQTAPSMEMPPASVVVSASAAEETMKPTSVLLDESVSFKDRLALAMKRKKEMMKNGVHFHKMFDDVLVAVMENANPYLIGPSGCGKTFMVQQIGDILDVESVDIGYINEEYDILGFQTANGGYSCPNFYRCYKYGKIAFCDELDNGNSRATVKLNSFLSNTTNGMYSFPHGERVARHPNFRIIAAGNTTGNGADANYSTREKIEESVQQRFTPIFVGYDNEVEKSILSGFNNWYSFVCAFREATNAWTKYSRSGAPGIITTRDVTRIRKYLENGSFNQNKIIEYEFVQTKDPDYLAFLAKEMRRIIEETKIPDPSYNCNTLYNIFAKRVKDICDGLDTDRIY